jgi:putative ABC transport system permease protein
MSGPGLVLAAVEEIAAYKLRTALSVLSVVVGIASVTLIIAVGEVGRAAAVNALERQAGRAATLSVGIEVPTWSPRDAFSIAGDLRDAAALSGASAVSIVAVTDGSLSIGRTERPAQVVGTQPELSTIRRLRLLFGRWIRATDDSLIAPVIVMNRPLAADLGLTILPIGPQDIRLNLGQRVAATLIGIVDDGQPTSVAYVPLASSRRWSLTTSAPRLFVWVPPEKVAPLSARELELADRAETRIEVQRVDDPQAIDNLIRIIQVVLAAIAALSLVSGGIGIINLGFVTVSQRSREFAIRRAFGATRRAVFAIVCIESAITVILAGAIGIAVAVAGTVLLTVLASSMIGVTDLPPFPVSAAFVGVVVSIALAVATGLLPGRAATSKSIIHAIRD